MSEWSERAQAVLVDAINEFHGAVARGSSDQEAECRNRVGSSLGNLLDVHLAQDSSWGSAGYCDGVLPASFSLSPAGVLETHGLMCFLSGQAGVLDFVEPFFARVRLGADRESIAEYAIGMGLPSLHSAPPTYGTRGHRDLEKHALTERWGVEQTWEYFYSNLDDARGQHPRGRY